MDQLQKFLDLVREYGSGAVTLQHRRPSLGVEVKTNVTASGATMYGVGVEEKEGLSLEEAVFEFEKRVKCAHWKMQRDCPEDYRRETGGVR